MEKIEIRAVIKYFFIKGLSPTEIKADLDGTLGDSAPSFATVKNWVAEFKRGRTSTKDADVLADQQLQQMKLSKKSIK
uniref:HTH_48 domain-containing protein n=1 Tax=Strongyloides stercoralis TaxID=6248 RepID=A0A0K0EG22_STRER